jgi:hypothetical protein
VQYTAKSNKVCPVGHDSEPDLLAFFNATVKGNYQLMKTIRVFSSVLLMLTCLPAAASHVTLSARWDGSEDVTAPLPGTCTGAGNLAYRQFNAIQVSMSGQYYLSDASDNLPGNVVAAIYSSGFDPADTALNRVASIDQGGSVTLVSGMDYFVVVQHWCSNNFPAAFAVSLSGPGDINGADVVASPAWTLGKLDGSDPEAVFAGVQQNYVVSEVVTVPVTGLYWYADVSVFSRLDIEVRVYEESFDPFDTGTGLVARLDDSGNVVLESGTNYLFVVTAFIPGNTGEWHWVLSPPGPLQFNAGLNGAWFNFLTPGQGIMLDLFTEIRLVFLAWFAFDLQRPDPGVEPMIGEGGHRWFTAFGNYAPGDSSITLTIENSTGGVFDSANPEVVQDDYGTIELEFTDCLNGKMIYNIPAGPVAGVIPLSRIANDHLDLCARLSSPGPGVIAD